MPIVVSFISQKGGVGKSALARALAAVAAHAELKVCVADLDEQQGTVVRWGRAREASGISPRIKVAHFNSVDEALEASSADDLLIIDAPGHVTAETLAIAKKSHVVVQPTGPGVDDLHPAVLVFHGLVAAGVPRTKLLFALCRTGGREEEEAARTYLSSAGYEILRGSIPERAAYRQALNAGRAPTETDELQSNKKADALVEALLNVIGSQLPESMPSRVRRENGGAA